MYRRIINWLGGGTAALLLALLAGCADASLLGSPEERIPSRLELELDATTLYAGESAPLSWRLYDNRDRLFTGLPAWAVPDLTPASDIVRIRHGRLEAIKAGMAPVTLTLAGVSASSVVRVNPSSLLVSVASAYITQGIQRFDGTVPLVAGRSGHMRVFLVGNDLNFFSPTVRVKFFRGGQQIATLNAASADVGVPTETDEGDLARSWNVPVPASLITPGTSFLVEVNQDGGLRPAEGSALTFPASGEPRVMDARVVPPFRIRFVPIHIINWETGDINDANVDSYMEATRAVWPISVAQVDVREPYSTTTRSLTDQDWSDLLREIRTLRLAEDPSRYYHGILRREGSWSGLGYVGYPVAITRDGNSTWTVAHELGHNFNRRHAPCGGPSGVDGNFPYPNGGIGVFGLSNNGTTVEFPARADLMTYCSPRWVSDYSFVGALNYRLTSQYESFSPDPAPVVSPVLIVSGVITGSGVRVDPVFTARSAASLPDSPGPYSMRATDDAGAEIFSLSFAGDAISEGDSAVRHFAFAVPLGDNEIARIARIEVRGASSSTVVESTHPASAVASGIAASPAQDLSAITAVRQASGLVRFTWRAAEFPLLVVRHPDSGVILGMLRGGEGSVVSSANRFDAELSDGVRVFRRSVAVGR